MPLRRPAESEGMGKVDGAKCLAGSTLMHRLRTTAAADVPTPAAPLLAYDLNLLHPGKSISRRLGDKFEPSN
jgi:hypothetical protein